MEQESFQIETLKLSFTFQYDVTLIPESDNTGTIYYIKNPKDITIDKGNYRTIHTGIFLHLPDIVEQQKQNKVINVSKYFVQAFVSIHSMYPEKGLVQTSSSVICAGQQVDITIFNQGNSNFTIRKGDVLGWLSFITCPRVQLVPMLDHISNSKPK